MNIQTSLKRWKAVKFSNMPDKTLHAWEFKIYERTDALGVFKNKELFEIIGSEKANEYYVERGKRLDQKLIKTLIKRVSQDKKFLAAARARLRSKTSWKQYFQQLVKK